MPQSHESVGAFLRWGREARGERIEDASRSLRIRPAYLEAIEADRWDDLPAAPYRIGFVRSYATYLGADVEAVSARLRQEVGEPAGRAPLEFPEPMRETRIPANAITAICIGLSLVLYMVWYHHASDDALQRNLASVTERDGPIWPDAALRPFPDIESPRELVALDGNEMRRTASRDSRSTNGTADDPGFLPQTPDFAAALPVPRLEPLPGLAVDGSSPTRISQFATLPTDLQPATRSTGPAQAASLPRDLYERSRADSELRRGTEKGIVLHARRESWVEVRSEHTGAVVFTKLLRQGEHWVVPDEGPHRLTTGNAGGLDILVDGVSMPSLGPDGAVRRDIVLERAHLLAGARSGG